MSTFVDLSPGSSATVDGVEVVVLAHEPHGFTTVECETAADFSLEDLNLQAGRPLDRDALASLAAEAQLRREALTSQLGGWNEMRPLPCWFAQDGSRLQLGVSRRDYATRRVMHTFWEQADAGLRERATRRLYDGGLTPLFAGTVGVHLTVVTSDGRFVIAERSSQARSHEGHRCLPVMEGAHDGDRVDGQFDPYATAVRGLREELGLVLDASVVTFHTLWVELSSYGVVLQGHVDLRGADLPWRDVLLGWQVARDRWETDSLEALRDSDDVLDGVFSDLSVPWIPWARFAVGAHAAWREALRDG